PGKPPTPPDPGAGGHPADPGVAPAVVSTVRISVGGGGVEGNGDSLGASISPDGHWVAFESSATNLVGNDANGPTVDVFAYHVDDQSLHLASVGGDGNLLRLGRQQRHRVVHVGGREPRARRLRPAGLRPG